MNSLYLHIPFCTSKCPYCDFYSQVGSQRQIDEYVELLSLQLQQLKQDHIVARPLNTVYFGGGTPSLLSPRQVEFLLQKIEVSLALSSAAEITLEINPGSVDLKQLQGYRRVGVNRLSIGIQSLQEDNLRLLGRTHSVDQARASIVAARTAGFDNLSLDLMFALPGQNLSALAQEISGLLKYSPEHISVYGLSFEEGTEFAARKHSGQLSPCPEVLYVKQFQLLHEKLGAAGFEHYEISNFARPGNRCRHNQTYWQRRNCLAVGAGAHSFNETGWGERWHVPAALNCYRELLLRGENPAELVEKFDHQEALAEFVYLSLRTKDGINLKEFEQRFKVPLKQAFPEALEKVDGYLNLHPDHSRCSFDLHGWLIYDHLISNFL